MAPLPPLAEVDAASLPLHAALVTVIIPLGITAFGGVAAAFFPQRWQKAGRVIFGAGLAAAVAAAYVGTSGRVPWPPVDASGYLPYATLLAAAMWALSDLAPFPWVSAFVLRLALFGSLSWLLFREPAHHGHWPLAAWVRYAALPSFAAALTWTIAAPLTRRSRAVVLPSALVVALSAASALLLLNHSARIAQFLGGVAAACGGALVLVWIKSSLRFGDAALAAAMSALGGTLIYGHYYVDLGPLEGALVLSALPFGAWLGALFARGARPNLAIILLTVVLTFTVAGPAVLWAWRREAQAAEDPWAQGADETLYGY